MRAPYDLLCQSEFIAFQEKKSANTFSIEWQKLMSNQRVNQTNYGDLLMIRVPFFCFLLT